MKELEANPELDENFEKLDKHQEEVCPACHSKNVITKSATLKESLPHKLVGSAICQDCGVVSHFSFDLNSKPYGIRIVCDFSDMRKEDVVMSVKRMAFLNSKTRVYVYEGKESEEPLVDYFSAESMINSVEGILMAIDDTIRTMSDSVLSDKFKRASEKLKEMMDGCPFTLVIEDNSGFSRVCPVGVEYNAVQNMELEEVNSEGVKHSKVAKKEE